jgi:cell wall-associated NlpC family hydrolase
MTGILTMDFCRDSDDCRIMLISRIRLLLALIVISCSFCVSGLATAGSAPPFATAVLPTPVFHTPDIAAIFGGQDGKTLRLDGCGQIRELEFIAFPGTVFRIEAATTVAGLVIYRVSTDEYPYPTDKGYFIDSRFVKTTDREPAARLRRLPSRETVIENLIAAKGVAYVWGGNFHTGIPQLLAMYPSSPDQHLSPETTAHRQLRGVDCSGLLYEATGGYTPRNTSALINYGTAVPIAGLDTDRISGKVEPLDLIVWNGHVMIILDRQRVIESRLDCGGRNGGVKIRPLKELLADIMKNKIPVDFYADTAAAGRKVFVIRRWYEGRNPEVGIR